MVIHLHSKLKNYSRLFNNQLILFNIFGAPDTNRTCDPPLGVIGSSQKYIESFSLTNT